MKRFSVVFTEKKSLLSEDTATAYLDGVLADAEASIDYDLISSSSIEDNTSKPPIKRVGSLTIVSGADNNVLGHITKPKKLSPPVPQIKEDDLPPPPMDLPPPPMDFLDDMVDENRNDISMKSGVEVRDLPPQYSKFRSDSMSSTNSTKSTLSLPLSLMEKPFMEWSTGDVSEWLDHLSLSQYKDTFLENDIEGKHLTDLSKEELKELGVKKIGHRMTLDDAIHKLRNSMM